MSALSTVQYREYPNRFDGLNVPDVLVARYESSHRISLNGLQPTRSGALQRTNAPLSTAHLPIPLCDRSVPSVQLRGRGECR